MLIRAVFYSRFMKIFRKQKVCIYIDGNNFYKYLKNKEIDFPKGTKFDFKKIYENH